MTFNARAILAAVLALILSAAVLTTAAPIESVMTGVKAISASMSLDGEPVSTFSIKITDEYYNADAHSGFLAVAPGTTAPTTIAKVEVTAKDLSKDLLAAGLDFTIREACTAKAAWDAQGRGDVVSSGANWAAYASGNLAGKYGLLATSSMTNQNTIVSQTQSNDDKAGVTRVIMDPTLSASQHYNKFLIVSTANAPARQLGCVAINVV
ncbi:hypothetical protein GGF31_007112 [Allomyces arbusculus]|nr:hypothetical protein GGF31_007112 [Allomyces arbusculus]